MSNEGEEGEQLPASDYSPVEFYTLDWDEVQLAIRILELKALWLRQEVEALVQTTGGCIESKADVGEFVSVGAS